MLAQTPEQQNPDRIWIKRWLPAIFWAIVIATFSTRAFTADNTGHLLIPLLHWLFPQTSVQTLERMHFYVRKSGHFTEYFMLSLLVLRGIRGGRRELRLAWMAITLLAVACYASLDEFHQRFVPGRTPAISDVFLDTTAGAIALLAFGLVLSLAAQRHRNTTG